MKCVILQPSYLPWRGVFDQIKRADVFVSYDDVQYDRRGWRNRNRLHVAQGSPWLTIPVHAAGATSRGRRIDEIELACGTPRGLSHWSRIEQVYSRAPFFDRYADLVRSFYDREDTLLADFTIATTTELARALGIDDTAYLRSSTLGVEGRKSERLLAVLERIGADHYITGPAARSYLDEAAFARRGIEVEYMEYKYPDYAQQHAPFDGAVSIVDLLFMTGPDASGYIWGDLRR